MDRGPIVLDPLAQGAAGHLRIREAAEAQASLVRVAATKDSYSQLAAFPEKFPASTLLVWLPRKSGLMVASREPSLLLALESV